MDYRKHSTWSLMVSLWTERTRGLDQRQLIWRILRWWQISSMKANVFKFFLQRGEVYAVMCSMTDNWLSEWRSPDLCLPISVVSIFPPWLMVVFNNWLAKCLKVSLANLSWLHYTHCAVSPLPGLGRFVIALIKSPMQVSLWFQKLFIKPVQLPLWCWNTHSGNTLWEPQAAMQRVWPLESNMLERLFVDPPSGMQPLAIPTNVLNTWEKLFWTLWADPATKWPPWMPQRIKISPSWALPFCPTSKAVRYNKILVWNH